MYRMVLFFDDEYLLVVLVLAPAKDIEAAQRKMLDVAQKMIEDGIIERENS